MGKQTNAIQRKLFELMAKARGAAAAALYQEGLAVDAESVKRTPVDTGRLRATHYVSPPTQRGAHVVVEIGNGTEYAIHVHERTELHHKTGEAKFLQNAMNARKAGMLERLAKRTAANIKRGITSAVLDAAVPTSPAMDVGDQYAPTRRTFDVMNRAAARKDRRARVRAKRKAKKLAGQMADGRKRSAQRAAKAEKKAQRNAQRKQAKQQRKQASAQTKKAKAYAARWKAAEKSHAKKSRTGWKNRRKRRR
jgi:hypothetical protein